MKKNNWMMTAVMGIVLAGVVQAQITTTWTGGTSTNWNTSGNWDNDVPGDADNVVVPNTATKPTMVAGTYPAAGRFGSFEVQSGATVTCLGDPTVTNEASGGGIGGDGKIHGIGVSIFAASATIAGTLTADGKGFVDSAVYRGPSGGFDRSAAHGGKPLTGAAGNAYGSVSQPTALGSAGGVNGYDGGGAIKLDAAGTITLNGFITANGIGGMRRTAAGGSIWLICDTFAGSGTIRAQGGDASATGNNAGGGGRVAIDRVTSTFSGIVSLRGGRDNGSFTQYAGQPGTLWEPNRFPTGTPESPVILAFGLDSSYQYHFAGSETNYWDVTISNGWFEAQSGSLVVSNLVLKNGAIFRSDEWAYGREGKRTMTHLDVTGQFDVSGNSVVYLGAYTYDTDTFSLAAGSILFPVGDRDAINEDSGGTVAVKHGLGPVICARNATVNGDINGVSRGFRLTEGPGYGGWDRGGSYGGRESTKVGPTYGRLSRPTALGSGGAQGSSGGSAIMLDVEETLTLNGSVNLSGGDASRRNGSGGSIWIVAGTLAGSGTILRADGGAGTGGACGGGGRIAIGSVTSTYTGASTVNAGDANAEAGTVFRCTSVNREAMIEQDGPGVRVSTALAVSRHAKGVLLTRDISQWGSTSRLLWTDSSQTQTDLETLANTATYTITGLNPNGYARVFVDDEPVTGITAADVDGSLTISGVTLAPSVTVRVQLQPSGTVFTIR